MGKYLVMIYDDEAKWAADDGSVMEQNHKNHQAFAEANGSVIDQSRLCQPQFKGPSTAGSTNATILSQ